ncbi:hypothetical protein [Methylobacterium sp. WSM2598]|uniref:hypothetical protein n=1 Tax=Methylobacterium sp. WSM2598 TaxID=398261 RepID=UPI0012F66E36|nr:hypothetical protein [Methylobacterium sp. WSM2598]
MIFKADYVVTGWSRHQLIIVTTERTTLPFRTKATPLCPPLARQSSSGLQNDQTSSPGSISPAKQAASGWPREIRPSNGG